MEAILLPTDFSPTANNAAMYALRLAKQMGVTRIVLYHSYEIPVTVDPIAPGVQMLDIETVKDSSARALADFESKLKPFTEGITLETINEYGAMGEGLDEVCQQVNAGLVVMGISSASKLEEKLIGSTSVEVGKHSKTPVLIVPADAVFTEINEVMLASDFDKADETVPVNGIRSFLETLRAKLFVFHLEEKEPTATPSAIMGEDFAVHAALAPLYPSYHFAHNDNFIDAVNDFVTEHNIDIVISIPREHGFFASLFSGESHTKMLAFHSRVPVLVIHN